MFLINFCADSNIWQVDERIRNKYHEKFENPSVHLLNDEHIEHFIRRCIQVELDDMYFRQDFAASLSQTITEKILDELSEKYPSYKIVIQTYISRMTKPDHLNASYRFDPEKDRCLLISENNGHL